MSRGLFISFEGTEGSGKSTQIRLLTDRLTREGTEVCLLREPGGTPIGEEIRHTLQHSHKNHAMTAEAELLLMNASRAQLVREMIRPALAAGAVVLCDRFFDSTIAYQGYGRELDLERIRAIIDFAVGPTRPDLTLLFQIPLEVSRKRRLARGQAEGAAGIRDRMEEADDLFFQRVEEGFLAVAAREPERVRVVDGTRPPEEVAEAVWDLVAPRLKGRK